MTNHGTDPPEDLLPVDEVGSGESPDSELVDVPDETVTLRKSVLSRLGVFVKDFKEPANSFPNRYWIQFGYTLKEMLNEKWRDHVHPADRYTVDNYLEDAVENAGFGEVRQFRIEDAAGREHWIISTGVVESWERKGEPERWVGVDFDVSHIHHLEDDLRSARTRAEDQAKEAEALRTAGAVIASSLSRGDAAGAVISQLKDVVAQDETVVFELVERRLVTVKRDGESSFFETTAGEGSLHDVLRRRVPNIMREPTRADTFWLLVPMIIRNEAQGVIAVSRQAGAAFDDREIRFVSALSDYLALALINARLYEEMTRLATVDQLSNLPTRRAFFERAAKKLEEAEAGTVHTAIILDIDFFKSVNDDFGHIVGDEAIREIARVFRKHLRDQDILGRYGGEEFCAFLPYTDCDEGVSVAERICRIVAETEVDGVDRPITVGLGVASVVTGRHEEELSQLLNDADTALYTAKRTGRDRVVRWKD